MSPAAVTVEGLTKRYGDRAAVDDLTFELPRGVVAGFIGPNGAGKTTTMAMLLGLVAPTAGHGSVLGQPLDKPSSFLPRVGALIEGPAMYPGLTGTENLRVLAAMGNRDASRIPHVLEQVGLEHRADDRFREYSMGMKQRLGIAGALLGDPELLILDEPTNGLDPVGMREIRALIADIASSERTVLVSSHLLSEIEQVCDWLIVIEQGTGVYAGPAAEFVGGAATTIGVAPEHPSDVELLGRLLLAEGHDADVEDGRVLVAVNGHDPRHLAASINRLAHEHGLVLAELEQRRANLQDRYLSLVEGGLR
jgi:ABC-2 type transport system ATP-binding protein